MVSIPLKAVFGDAVHRFSWESGKTFQDLVSKLRVLFHLGGPFSIRYKDDEGENVTLASNTELVEAIGIAQREKRSVLRLVVELQGGASAPAPAPASVADNATASLKMESMGGMLSTQPQFSVAMDSNPEQQNLSLAGDAGLLSGDGTAFDDLFANIWGGAQNPQPARRGGGGAASGGNSGAVVGGGGGGGGGGGSLAGGDPAQAFSGFDSSQLQLVPPMNMVAPAHSMSMAAMPAAAPPPQPPQRAAPRGGMPQGPPVSKRKRVEPVEHRGMTTIEKRRARNRISAQKSRLRKKFMIDSMQLTNERLVKENAELRKYLSMLTGKTEFSLPNQLPVGRTGAELIAKPGGTVTSKLERDDFALIRNVSAGNQSFVLSNPHLPDNPIVFVSDSFLTMTGYTREEVVGRNCRFLQGPDTDQRALDVIRNGIKKECDATVTLLNYRKDGSTFWNQFFIAPLRDGTGKVVNFIGVQSQIELQPGISVIKGKQVRLSAASGALSTTGRLLAR